MTLRVLAHLLSYPDAELREHLPRAARRRCAPTGALSRRAWPNSTR
jgi:nitrate reductase assembly molybdenum cofactor insertion protein NarJ